MKFRSPSQARTTRTQTALLALATGLAVAAFALVCAAKPGHALTLADLTPSLLAAAAFWLVHVIVVRGRPGCDPLLLPLLALLTGLGLALLESVKPSLVPKQTRWVLLGLLAFTAAARYRHPERLMRYKYVSMSLGVLLLLVTSFFGRSVGGATLALKVGSFSFQPSELVRLLAVVFLAGYLSEKRQVLALSARRWWELSRQDVRYLGPLLSMWALSLLFLVYQRDLGAALLFFGIFLTMIYVASGRAMYVVTGLTLFAVGAYVCGQLFWHVRTRVDVWLNPWAHLEGKGYQIAQSLFALAWGGMTGTGLGRGFSAKVPAVHTDLIFAAAGEQLGFLGATAVLLCFAVLVARGVRIAARSDRDESFLLAAGLSIALALQVCVIVGGVLRVTPLTGVALPFLSYGGSSMVTNGLLVGLLAGLSAPQEEAK